MIAYSLAFLGTAACKIRLSETSVAMEIQIKKKMNNTLYFIYQFNSPEDISILWKNVYAKSLYT